MPQAVENTLVKPAYGAIIAATLAIMAFELSLPVVILQIYDRVLPNGSESTLTILVLGAAALVLLDVGARWARSAIVDFTGAAFSHRIARRAMERVLGADTRQSQTRGPGENLSLLYSVRALKTAHNGEAMIAAVECLLIPLVLTVIWVIAGWLFLVPLSLVVAFALVSVRNGLRLRDASDARSGTDDRRYDFLIEHLEAMPAIRSQAMERRSGRVYEDLKLDSCLANRRVALALTGAFDTVSTFGSLMTFATVITGGWLALQGTVTVGATIASVLLASRLMQPLQRGLSIFVRHQDIQADRERAKTVLSLPGLRGEVTGTPGPNEGRMILEGVTLREDNGRPILEGADFSIEPGQAVALTGSTDRARTEILKFMAGLRAADEGRCVLNGCDLRSLPQEAATRQVSYLSNAASIYRGTVMDNMSRFGETPLADVLYVANLLALDRELATLPRGLDTPLRGDATDPIPPGLRQRIMLVRRLAMRPRLILYDRADRGLDQASYRALYSLLSRLNTKVALVLVSSDPSVSALANRTVKLEGCKFVETGAAEPGFKRTRYREVRL